MANKRLAVISEFVSSSGDSAAFESLAKKTGESRNPVITENMHNAYPIIVLLATNCLWNDPLLNCRTLDISHGKSFERVWRGVVLARSFA